MIDVRKSLRDLATSTLTFEDLLAQFNQASFTVRQPTKGSWAAVYTRAEEDMHDDDVPELLASAKFARKISPDQYEQLMAIYRQRVTQDQPVP